MLYFNGINSPYSTNVTGHILYVRYPSGILLVTGQRACPSEPYNLLEKILKQAITLECTKC
jgi:hypothetical protein